MVLLCMYGNCGSFETEFMSFERRFLFANVSLSLSCFPSSFDDFFKSLPSLIPIYLLVFGFGKCQKKFEISFFFFK